MDELNIYKAAFNRIKEALDDWALTENSEKEGIWYVSGIVDATLEILKDVKKS